MTNKVRAGLFKVAASTVLKKKKTVSILNDAPSFESVVSQQDSRDWRCRFDSFPKYRELVGHRVIADKLNIDNPFFKRLQGAVHATCMIDDKRYVNFSSYNYLDLNGAKPVVTAAKQAIDEYGTSVSGSRILSGERSITLKLEQAIAKLHRVEHAVVFVSGHATNVTCIGYLFSKDDLVIHDEYIHNSVLEGIQLSGATRLMFPHNNLLVLDELLTKRRDNFQRVLIVVEGLYGMDGDFPDLPQLIALKRKHQALLMVDEAHSIGVMGASGRGIAEHFAIDSRQVDIWMGTLSKAFAGCGGYIAGCSALVEHLKIAAPGQRYSVGIPPPMAAASLAAIETMLAEPERIKAQQLRSQQFLIQAKAHGLDMGVCQGFAVLTLMCGGSRRAVTLSNELFAAGIYALPIIYPAVAESKARIRFFISSAHTEAQISACVLTLAELVSA